MEDPEALMQTLRGWKTTGIYSVKSLITGIATLGALTAWYLLSGRHGDERVEPTPDTRSPEAKSTSRFRDSRIIEIKIKSAGFNAGNAAIITINNVPVVLERNVNNHYRGLHIVVINPKNGYITVARVFDTYWSSKEIDKFIQNGVPEGNIVLAACMDECVKNLSHLAKKWFASMGARSIWDLEYRQAYAFCGISGKKT